MAGPHHHGAQTSQLAQHGDGRGDGLGLYVAHHGREVCVCVLPKLSGTLGRETYWPMSKIRPAGGKKEQRDEEETSVEWAEGTGNRR